jgi:tRNA threonylcarbamoyladenosine biosynthesis protein TsaB
MSPNASVVLAIDTTGPRLQLALRRADGVVDTVSEPMDKGQAEAIFPAIAALLQRNALGYTDLARIAVTTGPGSFTGLRIGLSAARGLGLARSIAVIGVPTLTALSLARSGNPFRIVVDARRGEAYAQDFLGPATPASPAALVPSTGETLGDPVVPIADLARFAANADPALWPPTPFYLRDADAKPQDAARLPRRVGGM